MAHMHITTLLFSSGSEGNLKTDLEALASDGLSPNLAFVYFGVK